MITPARLKDLSLAFARFPAGTTVFVPPGPENPLVAAALMAGMKIALTTAAEWQYPHLLTLPDPSATLVGQDEVDRHNQIRDHLADGINSTPRGIAVTEIPLQSTLSQARADADIISTSPRRPGDADFTLFG